MKGWIAAIVAGGLAMPASAAWHSATTRHFVVYSDAKPDEVRKMATELEQFDTVLRFFHQTTDAPEATSNRLTIYALSGIPEVEEVCGSGCRNIAGFYLGRASGSVAFTPRRASAGLYALRARTVLLHEYTHHFLLGSYAIAYPAWFSEGYAEFFSTIEERPDGWLIGRGAAHRAYNLDSGVMSARDLFDPTRRKTMSGEQVAHLYGRGWLLTHYLMLDQDRMAKLDSYLQAINRGVPSVKAAENAFGDLNALDRSLNKYMRGSVKPYFIAREKVAVPDVQIRALTPGESALIDQRIRSDRGVDDQTGPRVYQRAIIGAKANPGDATAQAWFAEMAYDAKQYDVAEGAADRALAQDPKNAQALIYKGLVRLERAAEKKGDAAAFASARQYFVRANRLDPNNAEPLLLFYSSFISEGIEPTASAKRGLLRAQELVPQDSGLRMTAVFSLLQDGKPAEAKALLRPLAYNPHASADSTPAKVMATLDAGDTTAALALLRKADGETVGEP